MPPLARLMHITNTLAYCFLSRIWIMNTHFIGVYFADARWWHRKTVRAALHIRSWRLYLAFATAIDYYLILHYAGTAKRAWADYGTFALIRRRYFCFLIYRTHAMPSKFLEPRHDGLPRGVSWYQYEAILIACNIVIRIYAESAHWAAFAHSVAEILSYALYGYATIYFASCAPPFHAIDTFVFCHQPADFDFILRFQMTPALAFKVMSRRHQ